MKYNKQGLPYRPGLVARLDGQRFGLLKVIGRAPNAGGYAMWNCRCDCGVEIIAGGNKLRQGRKNKCASSAHKAQRPVPLTTMYKSEYQSWINMRERCNNPKHGKYYLYGGRGITVCERWQTSFRDFMLDMGRKSDPKFTIERKDVNGNYEPKNCKWISRAEQGRNMRHSVFVTYKGRKMLLMDLTAELGLSRNIVYQRLKMGWPLDLALFAPVNHYKKKSLQIARP